ncbi:MAG TPA: dTDP-4-dehydrorhamnose reductase [bacterium]|nr:dTDP-4-dehydrorhamnose reductase [bacterium]
MKVLVTGAEGMLGRDLVAALTGAHEAIGIDIAQCDLTDAAAVDACLQEIAPVWVINCAAYTAVDKAESEPELAQRINGDAPGNLARACRAHGARLLHLSTDYVFDGTKDAPYLPDDPPRPLGAYGRSKFAGEQAVRAELGDDAAIVRTAWLYGPHGHNFVKAIMRQVEAGKPLRVVDDQYGAPTYTGHLAQALIAAIEHDLRGTHHATNAGWCTWCDFARAICDLSGHVDWEIAPLTAAQLALPAPRPTNSRLDTSSMAAATGHTPPPWHEGLIAYLVRENIFAR